MPAPAVIPALIAYVKVVAVKTLVVGNRPSDTVRARLAQRELTVAFELEGGGQTCLGIAPVSTRDGQRGSRR